MPVTIRCRKKKKKKKRCCSVKTPNGTHSVCTSRRKAEAQRRLLLAVEHNPEFRPQ